MINYLIFTTGRTGSTLLCDYMRQMGLGTPKWTLSLRQLPDGVVDMKAYIESKRVNGYLGASTAWDRMFAFSDRFNVSLRDLLNCFPNPFCIYMDRRNKVRQAVSMVKHQEICLHVEEGKNDKEYKTKESALIDKEVPIVKIRKRIHNLSCEKFAFETFFERFNITPLRITYESFIENKMKTLNNIANFLRKDINGLEFQDKYSNVSSEIDDKWYNEFMKSELNII